MIGSTISHYKILEKLGEGGMGVVYKATDTQLNRTVALKFLPEHISASESDAARFTQEAQAAAALNHPNICTIYGIEEADGKHFIVMEFVDGQTLQEKKSSLSMKQALDIGIQIAEGLAAAHEKGIVHRDIKPENIMIRKDGRVQIMDFGLAKLRGASRLTKEGSTVGTAGYMAPEQIQGQETDHRSDIFSLGVLLYEMLSHQAPFKGVHETAIAYEIVNVDSAPMSSINEEIPPELDAIVLDCLEKDPKERTQAASQVALELKRYRRESSRTRVSRVTAVRPVKQDGPPPSSSPSWLITLGVGVGMLVLGFFLSMLFRTTEIPLPVLRASLDMPPGIRYDDALGGNSAISPDGLMVLFAGRDSSGQVHLWIRDFAHENARMLPGTQNANYPFWSPDNRSVGFFADGKLKTTPASGGSVLSIADAPFGRGAAWGPDGKIILCPKLQEPNLYAVAATGGPFFAVTSFDSTSEEVPRFPSFLPDGDHFLFTRLRLSNNKCDIYAGSVKNKETVLVLKDGMNPIFSSGMLLFVRQGVLLAQPFDPDALRLSGEAQQVQGGLNFLDVRAKADFSTSNSRLLLYSNGSTSAGTNIFFISRDGSTKPVAQLNVWVSATLSPKEDRIAFDKQDATGGVDIWLYDLRSAVETRLTFFGSKAANRPVWSRDGSTIYFNSERSGKAYLNSIASDGSGEAHLLAEQEKSEWGYYPSDVAPDGKTLLVEVSNESTCELATLDLTHSGTPSPLQKLHMTGSFASFSPDGKWIVYQATLRNLPGKIIVSKFPPNAGTWQVSPEGFAPIWTKDGIIFFSSQDNIQELVPVRLGGNAPTFVRAAPLFPVSVSSSRFVSAYSATRKEYLAGTPSGAGLNGQLSVIVNWPELVKEGKSR